MRPLSSFCHVPPVVGHFLGKVGDIGGAEAKVLAPRVSGASGPRACWESCEGRGQEGTGGRVLSQGPAA